MGTDIRHYLRRWTRQGGQKEMQGSESSSDPEFAHYDFNKPIEISDYIQKRFLPVSHWFKNRTRTNMHRFRLWSISVIVLTLFIVIFDISALGYYVGGSSSTAIASATAIASSIAAVLILGSTAFVQLTRTQDNWLLFNAASQRLEREYQLFTLKAGIYSDNPSSPSIADTGKSESESESENDKTRNKLFVENIENIISSHTSEGGPNISLRFS
jgi:Protein of unknown function (DUF4231)